MPYICDVCREANSTVKNVHGRTFLSGLRARFPSVPQQVFLSPNKSFISTGTDAGKSY